jgi:hypothetical protein
MTTNADLEPCPFCGKKVKFEYRTGDYGYTPDTVSVKCCLASTTVPTEAWDRDVGHYSIKDEARANIVSCWNKRV